MPDFDWENLKALLAVVRAGRLTAAAKRLHVDHSTLSRRICALESSLGTKLFDRRTGRYQLTSEGESLVGEAESVENVAIRIQSRLDNSVPELSGCVRIGMPEGFGTYFLAPRLARMTAQHPDLNVEIVASPYLFSLSKREADLAVTMARPIRGHLHARKLTDYELGIYASRSYLKQRGPIKQRAHLPDHDWVGYIQDLMWTPELEYFQQISPLIEPRVRISNVITQMMAVRDAVGLGVLPCFMATREPDLVRLFPSEARLIRSYWLVTHSDVRDLARVRSAMEFITKCVQDDGEVFLPGGVVGAR
ncbi:LysR family transcriptional regulator [Verrucomicrobia bacterium SCGC AG-212-E04]|nr:LysR family transcriptional regulator [Verrucomicrobia bacterium SCGC AG-212-E04]